MESQGFDWYALSGSTGTVKVEKDGKGLRELWVDQLQQFSKSGIDTAQAIARRYPSPKVLLEVRFIVCQLNK